MDIIVHDHVASYRKSYILNIADAKSCVDLESCKSFQYKDAQSRD